MRARLAVLILVSACTTELAESSSDLTGDPVIDCPVVQAGAIAGREATFYRCADQTLTCGPDGYLLGYRSRDLILEPKYATRILDGGMIQAALVVAGRIVGTWRLERRGATNRLEVHPFTTLPRSCPDGLRQEADDVGRFLGIEVSVAFATS